ncbi:hypothetical protein MYOV057v1_p0205 [Vibrio phage 184E37.1]|nr:hypothetical protein MYOV057v1_p0205 [Vibrio phage 184E37.1]
MIVVEVFTQNTVYLLGKSLLGKKEQG